MLWEEDVVRDFGDAFAFIEDVLLSSRFDLPIGIWRAGFQLLLFTAEGAGVWHVLIGDTSSAQVRGKEGIRIILVSFAVRHETIDIEPLAFAGEGVAKLFDKSGIDLTEERPAVGLIGE